MQRHLEEFEIPERKKLSALSHGQQKKFLLSFGLACNASLVVLDEPTNGLDIPSKGLFRRLVAEAVSEDRTIVVSTHQVRDVESLVDLVVILHEGKVLLNRSVAELSENLRFSVSASRPEAGDGLIYTERTVGGYASVWNDRGGDEGALDMELLVSRPPSPTRRPAASCLRRRHADERALFDPTARLAVARRRSGGAIARC